MAAEQPGYRASTLNTTVRGDHRGVTTSAKGGEWLDPVEARAYADSIHTAADVAEAAQRFAAFQPETLNAIGKAATAGCARKAAASPERVYVLASSPEHAKSFARDWAVVSESRRPSDCVDLLADHPILHAVDHPLPRGAIVIRLARAERREYFDRWSARLKSEGIRVRDVEEVAACAL